MVASCTLSLNFQVVQINLPLNHQLVRFLRVFRLLNIVKLSQLAWIIIIMVKEKENLNLNSYLFLVGTVILLQISLSGYFAVVVPLALTTRYFFFVFELLSMLFYLNGN